MTRPMIVAYSPDSRGRTGWDSPVGARLQELTSFKFGWHDVHGAKPPAVHVRVDRKRVADWIAQRQFDVDSPLVLLGRVVWDAFSVPIDAKPWEWFASPSHRHPLILFPHPFRRDPPWSPQDYDTAVRLLEALGREELPRFERGAEGAKNG